MGRRNLGPLWRLAIVGAFVTPRPSAPQDVRGRVVERDSGTPVVGAVVVLLGDQRETRAVVLSGDDGTFTLRTGPGTHLAVRVERVGYRTVETPPFPLAPGETVTRRIVVAPTAVDLRTVRVVASRRCLVRPADGELAADLWAEARKVLAATRATERERLLTFRIRHFERELDAETLHPMSEHAWERDARAAMPFVMEDSAALRRAGYVRRLPDRSLVYSAPDADWLLSDAFLDAHCFRPVSADAAHAGAIGLAFEPVRERRVPEIAGVLWIDRERAALQTLEYRYTHLEALDRDLAELAAYAGGRLEFVRLPNERWVVHRWHIRMPVPEATTVSLDAGRPSAGRSVFARTVQEAGAEIVHVSALPTATATASAGLVGVVWDSLSNAPVAGAAVQVVRVDASVAALATPTLEARADTAGRYAVPAVTPGRYRVTFESASPDSLLRMGGEARELTLDAGRRSVIHLGYPGSSEQRRRFCGRGLADSSVVLVGLLRTATGAPPAARLHLEASWTVYRLRAARLAIDTLSARATTDSIGRFVLCGLPSETLVAVNVTPSDDARRWLLRTPSYVRTRRAEVRRLDLRLDPGSIPD